MTKRLKLKTGFTIVEVTLVLAISALLVSGVMVGTSTNIARQRYNDAIVSLTDYFRQAYSEVINVQNVRSGLATPAYCSVSTIYDSEGNAQAPISAAPGRTNCAIYGKLLTIGERSTESDNNLDSSIHSYDIIGKIFSPNDYQNSKKKAEAKKSSDDASGVSSSEDIETLKEVGANVVTLSTKNTSECTLATAGAASFYNPLWGVNLETTSANNTRFRGAILIFRSPLSGTVQTYYVDYSSRSATSDIPIDISYAISQFPALSGACNQGTLSSSNAAKSEASKYLTAILNDPSLATNDSSDNQYLTICAASDDLAQIGSRRRGIRILKGGHNATAIELLNADILRTGEENPCR